jgi:hypothetical protein
VHGINGGNPKFSNINNVIGPDGIPFSSDDGLIPQVGSPLCSGGLGGVHIGAYPCSGSSIPIPIPTPVNGFCSTNLNQCLSGNFQDVVDTSSNNLWNCLGSNGGSTAFCSILKSPVIDITGPVISGVSTTSVSQTEATIVWTTNEPSTSQIEYGLTNSYGSFTVLNSSLKTSHVEKISNLNNNTIYHFRVISKDASSNISQSQDFYFSTLKDGVPPVRSNGLPIGTLASSTLSVVVSLSTDEPSMCYYSTSPNVPFNQMTTALTNTGDKSHSMNWSVQAGSSYFIYVKCRDNSLNYNTNDFPILFSVAAKTASRSISASRRLLWMSEAIDLNKEKNFFETRVTEYKTGGTLSW